MRKVILLLLLMPTICYAIDWELCDTSQMMRVRTPHGWIVDIVFSPHRNVYVPDEKHEWKC